MSAVLAVDLGGTKTATAIVDRDGGVSRKRKSAAERTLEGTVAQIAREAREVEVSTAGILVPGIYDARTGMAWAPNLWGMEQVPLRDAVERAVEVPVTIGSDRAGYVLGEQWIGAARGCSDVVYVAVGTGIGVGIIAGGRLIEGAHGIAGAAGWIAMPGGENWESEAAGPAVARRGGAESAEVVVERARAGDAAAVAAMRSTAEFLAMGVANLISVFDPEMVVLGGGLMQAGDLLMDDIRRLVPRWAQPVAAKLVRIELTALGEDAGLLGAARLAFLKER